MKYTTALFLAIVIAITSGCSYHRLGSLTTVATRNLDNDAPYVELQRGAEARVVDRHDDLLQEAVDRCIAQHPGGEYLRNAVIYMNGTGKRVKVTGDIWGIARDEKVAPPMHTGSTTLAIGDQVAWKMNGKMNTGTIVGLRTASAMVEYEKDNGKDMREVDLAKLTRIEK